MNQLIIILIACGFAVSMVMLAKTGAAPSLRSAVRTTMVLILAWGFALSSYPRSLSANTSPRTKILLILSVVVLVVAWALWARDRRRTTSGPPLIDRLNVAFAGVFAAVLLAGRNDPGAWLTGFLMVVGAYILTRSRI